MNGPPRLTERGGEIARVLSSAKRDAPPKDARGRALAATAALVAAAAVPRVTAAAAASSGSSAILKWIAIVAIGGGAAVYGAREVARPQGGEAPAAKAASTANPPVMTAPPTRSSAPFTADTSEATGIVPEPRSMPSIEPSARPSEPPLRRAPTTPPPPAPSSAVSADTPPLQADLADEIAALDGAKRALGRGDTDGTLALLDRYGREFPRGALGQEALVIRIRALARRGDHDGAVTLYRQLARSNPSSPHLEPLRRTLGLEP